MARGDDVEMQRRQRGKNDEDSEDTEYRPINWKRFFFAPKYLRTCTAPNLESGAEEAGP